MDSEGEDDVHETKESINAGKHGTDYEIQIGKFFLKRVIDNDFDDFRLTREKRGLGKFDDLTLVYSKNGKKSFRLVQIKHIDNKDKKINFTHLTSDASSYFLLSKYFNHYCESLASIKTDKDFRDAHLQDLIICTNISFEDDLKNITLKKLDDDEIFKDAFVLFRLEIPAEEFRKIFEWNYLSPMEQLAHELLFYILFDKQINISTLMKDEAVSMVKQYHLALAKSVINTETKQFNKFFFEEGQMDEKIEEFKYVLFKSAKEIFSSLRNLSDVDLKNRLKNIGIERVGQIRDSLASFESNENLNYFLPEYTFKLSKRFGASGNGETKSDTELPSNNKVSAIEVDEKVKLFLKKLVFAMEIINPEIIMQNDLKDLDGEFNKRIHKWYYYDAQERDGRKVRKWIKKKDLLNEALEKEVLFQGKNILIQKLISGDASKMDPQTLLYFLCSKAIKIGGDLSNLGVTESLYIERILTRPIVKIRKEVFHAKIDDIFIFCNVNKEYSSLKKLIPRNEELYCINDLNKFSRYLYTTERFRWETTSQPMLKLKELIIPLYTKKTILPLHVHWIELEGESLTWKQTYGVDDFVIHDNKDKSMVDCSKILEKRIKEAEIHNYFYRTEKYECFNESEIKYINAQNLIVVSAEPGMGKSTLFNHVAQTIAKSDILLCWLIQVDLKTLTSNLNETYFNSFNLLMCVKFVSRAANFDLITEIVLKYYIENHGKIVFLFDGYDELQTNNQRDEIIEIIMFIKEHIKNCSIWISTRPHLRENLENKLSTLAYSLQGISEDEQIDFLAKCWNADNLTLGERKDYAAKLITEFRKSINDHGMDFLGIPLQTKLLAVGFENELVNRNLCLPEYIDLSYLFKRFITTKYDIFFFKYCKHLASDSPNETIKHCKDLAIKSYDKMHKHVALTSGTLFPVEYTRSIVKNNFKVLHEDLLNIGIIVNVNNQLQFIHRTFAEYFAASRLVDWGKKEFENSEKYEAARNFLEQHICIAENNLIRYFFDHLITDDLPIHRASLRGDIQQIKAICQRDATQPDAFGRTPLYYAITYVRVSIIRKLLKELDAQVDIRNYFLRFAIGETLNSIDIIQIYVPYGLDIIQILLEKCNTELLSKEEREHFMTIRGVINAIRTHEWDILRLMMEKGACVNDLQRTPGDYIPLIEAIWERAPFDTIKALINVTDIKLYTKTYNPISIAWFYDLIRYYDYKEVWEVMSLLEEKGFNLNMQDDKRNLFFNLLIYAAHDNYPVKEIWALGVQILLENGAIFNLKNKNRKTPYQICKSKENAIKALLDKIKIQIKNCSSKLDIYLRKFKLTETEKDLFTITKVSNLLENLDNLFQAVHDNAIDLVHGCMQKARNNGQVRAVMNARNVKNQTIMEVAEEKRHLEILAILKSSGTVL